MAVIATLSDLEEANRLPAEPEPAPVVPRLGFDQATLEQLRAVVEALDAYLVSPLRAEWERAVDLVEAARDRAGGQGSHPPARG